MKSSNFLFFRFFSHLSLFCSIRGSLTLFFIVERVFISFASTILKNEKFLAIICKSYNFVSRSTFTLLSRQQFYFILVFSSNSFSTNFYSILHPSLRFDFDQSRKVLLNARPFKSSGAKL